MLPPSAIFARNVLVTAPDMRITYKRRKVGWQTGPPDRTATAGGFPDPPLTLGPSSRSVMYLRIFVDFQRLLPNLEGFWLRQPIRKYCKFLLFCTKRCQLKTGLSFCSGSCLFSSKRIWFPVACPDAQCHRSPPRDLQPFLRSVTQENTLADAGYRWSLPRGPGSLVSGLLAVACARGDSRVPAGL